MTGRPPLDEEAVRRALVGEGGLWRDVRVVDETGSTNADLVAAAREGAPEGLVVVAEWQRAGRGRLGRAWTAPPRSALTFSVVLRPGSVPPSRWTWLPLLVGAATADVVRRATGVEAALKWPNDVLVADRKLAGVLAEREADAVVVGVGLNVGATRDELPLPTATSLAVEGAATLDRAALLVAVLRGTEDHYLAWRAARGDAEESGLRGLYRARCTTVGRAVRVELPNGNVLAGTADDVDTGGRLVVRTPDGPRPVSAGDVVHVR